MAKVQFKPANFIEGHHCQRFRLYYCRAGDIVERFEGPGSNHPLSTIGLVLPAADHIRAQRQAMFPIRVDCKARVVNQKFLPMTCIRTVEPSFRTTH